MWRVLTALLMTLGFASMVALANGPAPKAEAGSDPASDAAKPAEATLVSLEVELSATLDGEKLAGFSFSNYSLTLVYQSADGDELSNWLEEGDDGVWQAEEQVFSNAKGFRVKVDNYAGGAATSEVLKASLKDGVMRLENGVIDIAPLLGKHEIVVCGSASHISGIPHAEIDSGYIGLSLGSKSIDVAGLVEVFGVYADGAGAFCLVFNTQGSSDAVVRPLNVEEIASLTFTPFVGGSTQGISQRKGRIYDLGALKVEGAILEVSTSVKLAEGLAWEDQKDADGKLQRIDGHALADAFNPEVSYATGGDFTASEYLGNGRFRARFLARAEALALHCDLWAFGGAWVASAHYPEIIDLKVKDHRKVELDFEMPALLLLEAPLGEDESFVSYGVCSKAELEQMRSYLDACPNYDTFDMNVEYEDSWDGKIFVAPGEGVDCLYLCTDSRAPIILELADLKPGEPIVWKKAWPEAQADATSGCELDVTLSWDGLEIPEGTPVRVYLNLYQLGEYHDITIGGKGPAKLTFENVGLGRGGWVIVYDVDGRGGFAPTMVGSSNEFRTVEGKNAIAVKMEQGPTHTRVPEGPLKIYATCGHEAIAIDYPAIPIGGRNLEEGELLDLMLNNNEYYPEPKLVRRSSRVFELQCAATAEVTVPEAWIEKFGPLNLQSNSATMRVPKAGTYSIWGDCGLGDEEYRYWFEADYMGVDLPVIGWTMSDRHSGEPIVLDLENEKPFTVVEFGGDTKGYRWSFRKQGGGLVGYSDMKPRTLLAVREGNFAFMCYREDSAFGISTNYYRKIAGGEHVHFPFWEKLASGVDGRAEMELTEAMRARFLREGGEVRYRSGFFENSDETYATIEGFNSLKENKPWTITLNSRISGNTLYLSEIPLERDGYLSIVIGEEESEYIPFSVKKDEALAKLAFPKLVRKTGLPEFPATEKRPLENYYHANQHLAKIHLKAFDGERLMMADEGFVIGKSYRIEVRIPRQDVYEVFHYDEKALATLDFKPTLEGGGWQADAADVLAPHMEKAFKYRPRGGGLGKPKGLGGGGSGG